MSRSEQLYTEINGKLEQFHSQLHRRRLANWVWVIVGFVSKSAQPNAAGRTSIRQRKQAFVCAKEIGKTF